MSISNIAFLLVSFIYIIMTTVLYYSKERINSVENRIFSIIIIVNIVGIVLDLSSVIMAFYFNHGLVFSVINKMYILYLLSWLSLFLVYTIHISYEEKKAEKLSKIVGVFYIIAFMVLLFANLGYYIHETKFYTYGLAANIMYGISGLYVFIMLICIFQNIKEIKSKKYLPIIIYIIFGTVVSFIQMTYPSVLVITAMESFVTILMYNTIENPDVKMIEQLNIARDQADRANNAKSDFLSSMSHEIRTPLNAIVGFSQALTEEELPYQAKEEVKDIMMASETLLDIVNGILDISKIEANKLELVNTEYNINTLLQELVSLTKARIGEKPLDLRYQFSPDIPKYLYGDKVRIKQVILNLLTNAVKYTKEGWIEFRVSCVKKDDLCRIFVSVQDTGMGIKKESMEKLFSRFERLDVEKNNTIEGTGLGLAITKKLVELMHGKIVVQSLYGEGSKFTIAFDQKIVENPTNPNLERTQMLDLSAIKNIDLTNRRILVVDDNKINLKVATRLLQDYHCIIDTLESGIECVDKIRAGASYDLILMDDMMPKQSGVETFHKLQQLPDFKTPVIALTANAISGMREKYLAEGFNDYLSKPIDKTELNRVLNKFIK